MGRKKGKQCGSFQRKSMNAAHTLEWQTRAYEETGKDFSSSNRGYAATANQTSSIPLLRPLSTSRTAAHVSRPIVRTSHLKNLLTDRQVDDRYEYQRFRQRLFQVTRSTSTVNNKKDDCDSKDVVVVRNNVGWLLRYVNERERIQREVLEEDYQKKTTRSKKCHDVNDDDDDNDETNHDHYQYGDVHHHHHHFIYPRKRTIIKKSESTSSLYEDDSISIEDNDHDDGVLVVNEDPLQQQPQLQSIPSLVTLCIKALAQPGVMQTYVMDCGYDAIHQICRTFSSSLLASLSTEIASHASKTKITNPSLSADKTVAKEKEQQQQGRIASSTGRHTTHNHWSLHPSSPRLPPWMGALMDHSHVERFVLVGPTNHDCDQHMIMDAAPNEEEKSSTNEESSMVTRTTASCRYCHDINHLFCYLSSSFPTAKEGDIQTTTHKQNNTIIMKNDLTIMTNGVATNTSVDFEDWEDRLLSDDDEDEDSIIMYDQQQQQHHVTTRNDHLSCFTAMTNYQHSIKNLQRLELLDVPYLDPYILNNFLQLCAPNMTHLRLSNVFHSSTGPQFLLQHLIQGTSQHNNDDWNVATTGHVTRHPQQMNDSFGHDDDRQSLVLLPQLEILDLSHNTWLTMDLLQEFIVSWMDALSHAKKQNRLERISVYGCGCCCSTEGLDMTTITKTNSNVGWFANESSSSFFASSNTASSVNGSRSHPKNNTSIWIDTQHVSG